MTAATDVLSRVEVLSPENGMVMNIRYHTPGSVITAGQPILDIVPENEPLLVEAKVGLRDVDSARIGAPVQVRLTAYNNRTTPPLQGSSFICPPTSRWMIGRTSPITLPARRSSRKHGGQSDDDPLSRHAGGNPDHQQVTARSRLFAGPVD